MAKRKKQKKRRLLKVQDPAAIKRTAAEGLQKGRLDEVIRLLTRRVEGKPDSDPEMRQMLAQAHFRRAFQSTPPDRTDLEQAVRCDAIQPQYRLALGLANLACGQLDQATLLIEPLGETLADSHIYQVARFVGLLACRRTREFKELQKRLPAGLTDEPTLLRLGILRHLLVGNSQLAEPLLTQLDSFSRSLYEGASRLVSGDEASAVQSLTEFSLPDRNPTAEEIPLLATQFYYAGVLHARVGDLSSARADWQEAQRQVSEHGLTLPWVNRLSAHWEALATAALTHQDVETAVGCLEQASAIEPENKAIAANLNAVRLAQANRFSQDGQLDRAVEGWRACIDSGLQDDVVLKNLAIACERLDRIQDAAGYWKQLSRLWRRRAKTNRSDQSLKSQLVRLERHAAELMLKVGRPPHEIIEELEAALKVDPNQRELRRVLADVLLEIGSSKKALRHLETILKQQAESPELLAHIGSAYEMAGRHNMARRSYERALALDPSFEAARRLLLQMMGDQASQAEGRGNYAKAIEICQQQLEIDPTYMPALAHLASMYSRLGGKKEAERFMQRILEIDPSDPRRQVNVGSLYLEMGRKRKAKTHFDKAVELEPSEPCFLNIGLAYLHDLDFKKALTYFDQAVAIGSVDTILFIVTELLHSNRSHDADKYLERALEQAPDRPDVHLSKADLMMYRGHYEEAKKAVNRAETLASNPKYASMQADVRSFMRAIRDIEHMSRFTNAGDGPPLPPDLMMLLRKLGGL